MAICVEGEEEDKYTKHFQARFDDNSTFDAYPGDIGIDYPLMDAICKYYGHVMKSDGVTRLKYHLSGMDPSHNVHHCESVPREVKSYIIGILKRKEELKAKNVIQVDEIRAELRGQLHTQVINVDEESDDDIIFPPGIDPYEKKEYREAIRASKQIE
ncbi:hypothetical protein FNV43_RR26725 [Rhamnella rubrinervis]|uniref:Uncharacterized protein n=1 Tax=Rhamnella rubrinervis TaxID=2594499 RepID=A0A8K0DPV0_9ROSA|nr:hypothetical protein FNV43_RR26725 [Rhamnella rubrinervis]